MRGWLQCRPSSDDYIDHQAHRVREWNGDDWHTLILCARGRPFCLPKNVEARYTENDAMRHYVGDVDSWRYWGEANPGCDKCNFSETLRKGELSSFELNRPRSCSFFSPRLFLYSVTILVCPPRLRWTTMRGIVSLITTPTCSRRLTPSVTLQKKLRKQGTPNK